MIKCKACGWRNDNSQTDCFRCHASLQEEEKDNRARLKQADRNRRRLNRSLLPSRIFSAIDRVIPFKRWWSIPEGVPVRFPWTAGALSVLVPGLGQFYNHQRAKAVLYLGLWLMLVAAVVVTWFHPANYTVMTIYGGLALGAFVDAVVTAFQINGSQVTRRLSFALAFGGALFFGLVMIFGQFFLSPFVGFLRLRDNSFAPQIRHGDRVIVLKWSYLGDQLPTRNEVIFFDPRRFSIGHGDDAISVNPSSYIQRVVAVAGDKVRIKNGVITVNDRMLPQSEQPFGLDAMPDIELEVPPGRVFAPVGRVPKDTLMGIIGMGEMPNLSIPGLRISGYTESALVASEDVAGRVAGVVHPPQRREWY